MSTVALSNHWYSQRLDPSNSSRIVVLTNQTRANPAAWNPIPRSTSTPCKSGTFIVPSCPLPGSAATAMLLPAQWRFSMTGEGYKPALCAVNGQLSVENPRPDSLTGADSNPSRKPFVLRPTTVAAGRGTDGGLRLCRSPAGPRLRPGLRLR